MIVALPGFFSYLFCYNSGSTFIVLILLCINCIMLSGWFEPFVYPMLPNIIMKNSGVQRSTLLGRHSEFGIANQVFNAVCTASNMLTAWTSS